MNATQGLIFYALRCRCVVMVEKPRTFGQSLWAWMRNRKTEHVKMYRHDFNCVACRNARTDSDIIALLDGSAPVDYMGQEVYGAECIAASTIGRKVVDGFYAAAPPSSGLTTAELMAGGTPGDELREKSQTGIGRHVAAWVSDEERQLEAEREPIGDDRD